jgi:peptidoglycan/LPS O-acetylase OafA/YrhL
MRPLKHWEFLALKRLPALDGLRAIATLLVIVFHFGQPRYAWLTGWIGVHIFFVLSGFLITTLALREESRAGRISLADFYIRRFARILPAYALVLAATLGIGALNGGASFQRLLAALPYYLTFTNEYAPRAAFELSWTLGIEQKFYLVWPLVIFATGRLAWPFRWAVVALLFGAALYGTFQFRGCVNYAVILGGCILALVMHHPRGFAVVRLLTVPVVALVVVAAFVALHLSLGSLLARFGELWAILIYGAGVVLLLPAVLGRGPVPSLLSLRPLIFIGQRSYSLYLVQMLASAAVAGLLPGVPKKTDTYLLAVGLAALASADLIYRWIELPFIEAGRRLVGWRRRHTRAVLLQPIEAEVRPIKADTPLGTNPAPAVSS